jgi:putative Mg2+ transporter-C (MgtC) family protein
MFLENLKILNSLNEISIFVRCFLSMLLAGVLGIEREAKRRPAGFRTYVIVCLGSALIMMTNQYIYVSTRTQDSTRIVAQVVSGIGFLGAGTILVTKQNQVKGLTTAAGLWACAALGIAVGCGFYTGAIMGFLAILCSFQVLHAIDSKIYSNSRILSVYIELDSVKDLRSLLTYARNHEIELSNLELINQKHVEFDMIGLITTVRVKEWTDHKSLLEEFAQLDGINFIEEIK